MRLEPIKFLWAVGIAGIGIFAASRAFQPQTKSAQVVQVAPLLQKVQALGELHAVKYTYRDVHEYQSSEEPASWLAIVPGGEEIAHAATKNSTLMTYTGTVEAGVDLSKAKIARTPAGIHISLPKPKIYPANVSAEVNDLHRGIVWNDISITSSAIEDAKLRFQQTGLRQGILNDAQDHARATVLGLSKQMCQVPVTVSFS